MLTYVQAIILGLVQGASEIFPVSSLGHSVILPALLGWHVDQADPFFLIFLVAAHFATSLVLLGFFAGDWLLIIKGIFRSLRQREIAAGDAYARLGWLIVVGTIPAGVLGVLFQDQLGALFALPVYAAGFLILNGVMLWGMEGFKKKQEVRSKEKGEEKQATTSDVNISRISWAQSVKIGVAQCLALIPGFSRTGAAMGGGLLAGLDHEDAARFSFLLATPIILAAAVLKLPDLIAASSQDLSILGPFLAGALAAALAAYLSVRFLVRYFQTKSLDPFAVYCVIAGTASLIMLLFR